MRKHIRHFYTEQINCSEARAQWLVEITRHHFLLPHDATSPSFPGPAIADQRPQHQKRQRPFQGVPAPAPPTEQKKRRSRIRRDSPFRFSPSLCRSALPIPPSLSLSPSPASPPPPPSPPSPSLSPHVTAHREAQTAAASRHGAVRPCPAEIRLQVPPVAVDTAAPPRSAHTPPPSTPASAGGHRPYVRCTQNRCSHYLLCGFHDSKVCCCSYIKNHLGLFAMRIQRRNTSMASNVLPSSLSFVRPAREERWQKGFLLAKHKSA